MLNESLNKYDYRKSIRECLYYYLFTITGSFIVSSLVWFCSHLFIEFVKIQINLNLNSCQAVRNEMLHDSYTPTKVDSLLCKVYLTICAENQEIVKYLLSLLLWFLKKSQSFLRSSTHILLFFLMKRMSWRTFCCHCMNYLFWCDSCRV